MIVIDPSKGGSNVGMVNNGITEKEFNLLLSQYIYDRLKQLGADVKIIRSTDEYINDADRANRILNAYGNNSRVIAISNQLGDNNTNAEVIYPLRNNDTLAKSISDNLENSGLTVDKYYQRRSESDTSKDYYNIQKDTGNIQTIIINYGNINNATEANNLKNNWEKYAEAVVKALANYEGIPYSLNNETSNTYKVQKGDSLYSIAKKFNTTVEEIKKLNNLKSNLLQIGDILLIPTISTDNNEQTYIVQKGDSLYQIALKFNTTVDNIKKLNNLTSNLLSIGQVLIISKAEKTDDSNVYIVQKGDSLYQIALKFNTTVDNIKKLNNLTSNLLSIGQKLLIPQDKISSDYTIYTVQKGDSLYQIALKFNTTVDDIKKLNNLTSNLLSIGEQLKIPN